MSRSIRVFTGVTNFNVTFDPPTSPYLQYALATVVDAALVSITGFNTFRCTYSFHFDPARTQVWQYSVSFTDGGTTNTSLEVPMTGQYNTGGAAAQALQDAVNAKEAEQAGGARVSITVTYSEGTKKFSLSWTQLRGTVNSFTIRGTIGGSGTYQRSAMSHFGNQHGADVVIAGANGSVEFAYAVRASRFRISFAGLAGSNRLSDAVNWEARDILGFSSGMTSDVTIRSSEGDTDVLDPAPPEPPPPPVFMPSYWGAGEPGGRNVLPVPSARPAIVAKSIPIHEARAMAVGRAPAPTWNEQHAQAAALQMLGSKLSPGENLALQRLWSRLLPAEKAELLKETPSQVRDTLRAWPGWA